MDFRRFKKDDLLWLANHRCIHGHTYLEHPACYEKEFGDTPPSLREERIGFFDIETSNLDANFGFALTYSIKKYRTDIILFDTITKEDIESNDFDKPDKRLIEHLIKDLTQFDRIVTHYGSRFDLTFIRTRALYCGLDFFKYGEIYQDDTWIMARRKLKLSSNRLDTVARAILGDTQKTRVEFKYWIGAMHGDEKSLSYILEHNKIDVIELEKVWDKIHEMTRYTKTSI